MLEPTKEPGHEEHTSGAPRGDESLGGRNVSVSELLGLTGAAIAAYAYLPQITHLVRERCSAGLSERAFGLWLLSSVLMTTHAISIRSPVFIVLGGQQIVATGVIAFFCRRYRGQVCPSHASPAATEAPSSVSLGEGDQESRVCRATGFAQLRGHPFRRAARALLPFKTSQTSVSLPWGSPITRPDSDTHPELRLPGMVR